jgi:hypothetical protein
VVRILADVNVPEKYVSALRGVGHEVVYSREVDALGPEATDEALIEYAEAERFAPLSTDVTGFADRNAAVSVFVTPQHMTGGEGRAAVARIETLPFDPAETDPV